MIYEYRLFLALRKIKGKKIEYEATDFGYVTL